MKPAIFLMKFLIFNMTQILTNPHTGKLLIYYLLVENKGIEVKLYRINHRLHGEPDKITSDRRKLVRIMNTLICVTTNVLKGKSIKNCSKSKTKDARLHATLKMKHAPPS